MEKIVGNKRYMIVTGYNHSFLFTRILNYFFSITYIPMRRRLLVQIHSNFFFSKERFMSLEVHNLETFPVAVVYFYKAQIYVDSF